MTDLRLRMDEENMAHMTQGHMTHAHHHHHHHGGHTGHAHAPPLMPSMATAMQNGHHHQHMSTHHQHSDPHDMARKYGIHQKMDDTQFNMTLNLVKSEGIHPHYLYGPLDNAVA